MPLPDRNELHRVQEAKVVVQDGQYLIKLKQGALHIPTHEDAWNVNIKDKLRVEVGFDRKQKLRITRRLTDAKKYVQI